jgi:protein TonB
MATMSGSTLLPQGRADGDGLFAELIASNPAKSTLWRGGIVSVTAHVVIISALILIPIFWAEAPPDRSDYVVGLIYNPPAAAAAPPPKGNPNVHNVEPAHPVTRDIQPKKPDLALPDPTPHEAELKPEQRPQESEQEGVADGSDNGIKEGLPGGVDGGVAGGIVGGVVGGCVGCTGDGAVMDYDQPPKPIKITRPQYPQEAFVKKIEGTVEVEILIDINGIVVRAHVVRSVPMLDAAALQTVYQWRFSPAIKNGHPVATIARAPVAFRIY